MELFKYQPKSFKRGKVSIDVENIEYHRNGISGEPFFVIRFSDAEAMPNMVGIVFANALAMDEESGEYTDQVLDFTDENWHNPTVAVLNVDLLFEGNIGIANKWRGDHYFPIFAMAIADQEAQYKEWEEKLLAENEEAN